MKTPHDTGRVKIGKEFCVNPFFKMPEISGDAFTLQGALLKREQQPLSLLQKLKQFFCC